MHLQKQLSKRVGKKEYAKWVIVIPPEKIKEMGWGEGDLLEVVIKNGKMMIVRDES